MIQKENRMENTVTTKKKRRWWIIPILLLLVLCAVGTAAVLSDAPSRREISALSIENVDFTNLKDGTYIGSFVGTKSNLRDTTVEVVIASGSVSSIRILKGAVEEMGAPQEIGKGKTAYDLFDAVVAKKTLQVDTISGATLTSKTHLKALEQALLQAQHEE